MSRTTLERLLTINELAEQLGWPADYVRELVATKQIPHVRTPSTRKGRAIHTGGRGRIYFEPSAIRAWLDERSHHVDRRRTPAAAVDPERLAECEELGIPVDHRYS
ncbi:MAG TPA: helix-turn-helix domain-containing protein [Vicinamibacterales bacterium]|nr:helix-turn-helix domain-containing protein [Vicinamibacterales bacterium]